MSSSALRLPAIAKAVPVVPGQQPVPKCQQDKGTACGLSKGTMEDIHSSYDQQEPAGKSEQLQVSRCTHQRGPAMDCSDFNINVRHLTAREVTYLLSYPEDLFILPL